MRTVRLSLDQEQYNSKPTTQQTVDITKRISPVELPLDELMSCVAYEGQTFCCAVIQRTPDGKFLGDDNSFDNQQVFALDFDNEIHTGPHKKERVSDDMYVTPEMILADCHEYGLEPFAIYESFNSNRANNWIRFRVLFVLADTITDIAARGIIHNQLSVIWKPFIDSSCSNTNRLFYGSNNGLLYENYEATLDLTNLSTMAYAKNADHNKKHASEFNTSLGFSKRGKSAGSMYYIETAEKPPFETLGHKVLPEDSRLENDIYHHTVCQLYHGIMDGTYFPAHDEWFNLGLNMMYFPRQFSNYIDKMQELSIKKERKKQLQAAKKANRYMPRNCGEWCPFFNICTSKGTSVYTKVKHLSEHGWVREEEPSYVSHAEMYEIMKSKMRQILTEENDDVYVIKCDTGGGKSRAIMELIQELGLANITIAYDTHDNASEKLLQFHEKMMFNAWKTVDIPATLPIEVVVKVKAAYSIGAFKSGDKLLAEYPEGRAYIADRKQLIRGLCLTTHSKVLIGNSVNNTVVFDEDPFWTMVQVKQANIFDVMSFLVYLKKADPILAAGYEQFVDATSQREMCINVTREFAGNMDKLYEHYTNYLDICVCESDVLALATSIVWSADYDDINHKKETTLSYVTFKQIPIGKKVIILSATANKTICSALYGSRLHFIELPAVRKIGHVYQCTEHSYSKSSLHKHGELLNKLAASSLYVITNINTSERVNAGKPDYNIHYGKTTNTNALEGQDIAVLSKHVLKPSTLRLVAKCINVSWSAELGFDRERTEVLLNGFHGYIHTFQNSLLQALDLWVTSSELEQAVGRNRSIHHDVDCFVFCDAVHRDAIIVGEAEMIRMIKAKGA